VSKKHVTHALALDLLKRDRVGRAQAASTIAGEQRVLRRELPRLGPLERLTVADVETWIATRL